MGDAAGESPDALHALGTKKLSFELFFLGNISINRQDGFWLIGFITHQCPATFKDNVFVVFGNLMQLTLPGATIQDSLQGNFKLQWLILVQNLISILALYLNCLPTIQAFGTFVPRSEERR